MPDKILHIRLDEKLDQKLERLARLSRRKKNGVIRLLIDDATDEQVGVRQPQELQMIDKAPPDSEACDLYRVVRKEEEPA